MNELILVTGGARSGKSVFAESLLADCERKFYLATAPVTDDEMRRRIRLHQERRAAAHWTTLENELDLAGMLRQAAARDADGVLVDCLTLWLNNLLYHHPEFQEHDVPDALAPVLAAARAVPGRCVMVLNEVGSGIVPESPLARTFRDVSGRCGQLVAEAADRVYLTVCGIPVAVKPRGAGA